MPFPPGFAQAAVALRGGVLNVDGVTAVTARLADGVAAIAPAHWDACAGAANPFLSHAFLSILEESGSVSPRAGWQAVPIIVDGADGVLAAIAPAYAKRHSQGEYVFDHAWADAWQRAGGSYYPKLQIAVPFTPVPGPRLLLRDAATAPALIAAIEAVVDRHGMSSAHATFVTPDQVPLFEAAGWLIRAGTQFHWANNGYGCFDDFLDALASRKRKAIRKERAAAVDGLTIRHVSGGDLTERDWDAFWTFYQDTG
ncbi:MAG: GNAT family N-acetyltransferase, partial [Sphingomonas sp.]|nr:GNAT family N-acetyltransferase [Sphingomonas sp.]